MKPTIPFPVIRRLWLRIQEPRVVSFIVFVGYGIMLSAALSVFYVSPASVEGEIGYVAMMSLAVLLGFGSLLGLLSVLQGAWFIERIGVVCIMCATLIYAVIIFALHTQATSGHSRLLQLGFVLMALLHNGVRLVRIWERPFDPDLINNS